MKYLKIQTLNKGWCDRDEILLHAAFQVLADFVKQEHPDRFIEWNADKLHKHAWKEIKSLYRWWEEIRPARNSPLDEKGLVSPPMRWRKIPNSDDLLLVQPDKKKYSRYYKALKKHSQLEQKWHNEDQRNLHRLIEIREFLWT